MSEKKRRDDVTQLPPKDISEFALEVLQRDEHGSPQSAKCLLCEQGMRQRKVRRHGKSVVIKSLTVHIFKAPFEFKKLRQHMKSSHSEVMDRFFNLSTNERLRFLNNEILDNRVGTIHQYVDVNNFEVKIKGNFVDLLINKLIVEDDNMSRERAKAMFGNLIDGEDEEDIIDASDDNGPAASESHYLISLHRKKFKTIQKMVATGITFRQTVKVLHSLRGTFGCDWMMGINSDMVQKSVRFICAINLQTLSGLMEQAYTYSIAVDVGSVGNTGYMDLRVRIPTPSCSFINVHVLPIPLLSGKSIDIFSMVDFVFVNAILEYLLTSYFFCFFILLLFSCECVYT
jgi:hypothetical protein